MHNALDKDNAALETLLNVALAQDDFSKNTLEPPPIMEISGPDCKKEINRCKSKQRQNLPGERRSHFRIFHLFSLNVET